MSTTILTQPVASSQQTPHSLRERSFPFALVTLLTAFALLVHGYHPYAEDGGLYAAGIEHLLDPALFPHSAAFVEAHLRFSVFAPVTAALVRILHLSLPAVLLLLHLSSIWSTLFALWLLAARCYATRTARAGAVTLMAAWLTVPVAGTSLILMDPYVTARSISLPCTLFALVAVIDLMRARTPAHRIRAAILCASMLLLAAITHPLMAAYAFGDVLTLAILLSASKSTRSWAITCLCSSAVVLAAALSALAPPETAAYLQVAITRYYWFLSRWQWYELIGLAAPLAIVATTILSRRPPTLRLDDAGRASNRKALAAMAVITGTTAILVALTFAHENAPTHLIARLQPLRIFQIVYIVMILVLGATLGERLLRRHLWRWLTLFSIFGGVLFYVQRSTYPSSAHIEWPSATPSNRWEQAFLWISHNTPKDALFALDANYISLPGEDAQSFRAIAQRSALPDYSKDGGEASITPSLTAAWSIGQTAQTALSTENDAARLDALHPLHVNWIVLQTRATTSFNCPYQNPLVKVCRLP
ncbi:hypothetical protein [Granulicella arctica]|uniref:Glycosyltransferase RgtA/B/C/D-like domain-containing protein n=1 Tax=Granulicella arctica TaxID=940613 RepID=A0A7Y9PKN6_9BACT|nr:hypothetical protein [Granulicella arctica]NYF80838.1 hypothetical protein [Granulicella arctica]